MTTRQMRDYSRLLLEVASDYYDAGAVNSAQARLEQAHHWARQAEAAEREDARQFNPNA